MAKRIARLLDNGMEPMTVQDLDHLFKSAAAVVNFDYYLSNNRPMVSTDTVEYVQLGPFGINLQIVKPLNTLLVDHIGNRAKLAFDVDFRAVVPTKN